MTKMFFELLLALLVAVFPFGNEATEAEITEPVSVTAEVTSQQEDGVKCARFQNILNHNYCFGERFDEKELLASASLSLSYMIEDGYIDKTAADSFVFNMYGVDTSAYPSSEKTGFYEVDAMGFATYEHTIKSFSYNGDGTLTVLSEVLVDGEETYDCVSVFLANGESAFGYNLLSCVVNW